MSIKYVNLSSPKENLQLPDLPWTARHDDTEKGRDQRFFPEFGVLINPKQLTHLHGGEVEIMSLRKRDAEIQPTS